jgi:hypothetical protein
MVLELDEFQQVLRTLLCTPRYPTYSNVQFSIFRCRSVDDSLSTANTHRLAWLNMPFPLRMGITDVDAVLNEMTNPSWAKGMFGKEGRLF